MKNRGYTHAAVSREADYAVCSPPVQHFGQKQPRFGNSIM
jgi:hypothetical protein